VATLTISADVKRAQAKLEGVLKRSRAPFGGPSGPAVVAVLRHGPGSVAAQFAAEATLLSGGGAAAWPRTKPFGNRPPPAKTLQRSGSYRAAWLGQGAGAVTRITPTRVSIGVDPRVMPRVLLFQARRAVRVYAKRRTAGGDFAMRVKLGLTYGVWISNRRLLQGILIPPRRLSVNPVMRRRAAAILRSYIATGRIPGQKAAA